MDGQEPQKKPKSYRLIFILGGLCLVAIMLTVFVIVKNNNNPDSDEETVFVEEDDDLTPDQSIDDYLTETEAELEKATTGEEKAAIYLDRAGELYRRQQIDEDNYTEEILSDAYKAEEIASSADTAYAIYYYEKRLGSSEVADKYLEIAKERGYTEGGRG